MSFIDQRITSIVISTSAENGRGILHHNSGEPMIAKTGTCSLLGIDAIIVINVRNNPANRYVNGSSGFTACVLRADGWAGCERRHGAPCEDRSCFTASL